MKREFRSSIVTLVTLAVALLLPSSAAATVTIGSNLEHTTFASTSCFPNCTTVLGDLAPDAQASGGVVSPVNGTVTTWRLGVGNKSGPTAFRVVRRLADGTFTGGGTSASVTPTLETDNVFSTNLPIQRGDLIGLDCCAVPGVTYFSGDHTGQRIFFEPGFLGDGAAGAMPSGTDTFEMLLNADIEPTATLGSVNAKPRKGGRIKVTMVVPNPGTLLATGKGLHSTATHIAVAGPLTLLVRPHFRTMAKLVDGKAVKAKLKLTFTPDGGNAAVQTAKVKLKR
jgi:hypothetical protein